MYNKIFMTTLLTYLNSFLKIRASRKIYPLEKKKRNYFLTNPVTFDYTIVQNIFRTNSNILNISYQPKLRKLVASVSLEQNALTFQHRFERAV